LLGARAENHTRKVKHDFPYSGLVNCGHCGCLLVGELKKGTYVYYHCTGNRGKCPEPYTRQEILSGKFANILEELVIPRAILDWLGDVVLSCDRTEQAARAESIKKLQARHGQIEARIEIMYQDRLDGRITQEFFDKQAGILRKEQDGVLRKIQDIQKATLAPVDQAIDMLRLTSRASEMFLQQSAGEQRRLLHTVVEKATWKDGALQTALFEPFQILRHSNQESYRKEKEKAGSGRDLGIWLPGMDSNHDNIKQRRICNLQSFQWSKMPVWTRNTITRTQLVHGSLLEVRSAGLRTIRRASLGRLAPVTLQEADLSDTTTVKARLPEAGTTAAAFIDREDSYRSWRDSVLMRHNSRCIASAAIILPAFWRDSHNAVAAYGLTAWTAILAAVGRALGVYLVASVHLPVILTTGAAEGLGLGGEGCDSACRKTVGTDSRTPDGSDLRFFVYAR
jgi:hypothetical protein